MTIREALARARARLAASDLATSPREASLLLGHLLGRESCAVPAGRLGEEQLRVETGIFDPSRTESVGGGGDRVGGARERLTHRARNGRGHQPEVPAVCASSRARFS